MSKLLGYVVIERHPSANPPYTRVISTTSQSKYYAEEMLRRADKLEPDQLHTIAVVKEIESDE